MDSLLHEPPQRIARRLRERGRRRAFFVRDASGALRASDSFLAHAAAELTSLRDFQDHEGLFLEVGAETGSLFAAAVHSTVRGQALGGVRHATYASGLDFLRDGLRLSQGMTRKSALAGLWWGGGKGVIARGADDLSEQPAYRATLYREYGAFVSGLRGLYVTAEDAGTSPGDMAIVAPATRFATCVPPSVGGSGDPSVATAAGVLCGMRAALDASGMGGLEGKRIAMQGAGQVGSAMIGQLLEAGVANIRVGEVSGVRREAVLDRFAGSPVEVVAADPDEPGVLAAPCDVLAPNALGGVLGPKTIPHVRARMVCGAANNQLVDTGRDGRALSERGILFVPEIVTNRMGVVHCANEQYGTPRHDPAVERHLSDGWEDAIGPVVRRVLARAESDGVPPVEAANALADEAASRPHPLWPGRGAAILRSLVEERWHQR